MNLLPVEVEGHRRSLFPTNFWSYRWANNRAWPLAARREEKETEERDMAGVQDEFLRLGLSPPFPRPFSPEPPGLRYLLCIYAYRYTKIPLVVV